VLIIVNPAAGGSRRSRRRLGRIVAALERRGCVVVVRHAGPAAGDAERLAREAEAEFDVIVAAGGDGTVNAVANGIAASPRALAVLPFGTANVLAREVSLPRRSKRLAELIATGEARPIWPGRVGDRLFLTTASSGFDAEIVAAVNPRLKRSLGRFAFAWAIMARLSRYRASALSVRADGAEHRAAGVIAAKGRFYAGAYVIAPGANIAEPVLDLVLLQRSGRLAVLGYLAALLLGRVARRRDIAVLRCRTALVAEGEPLPVQADGEIVGQLPIELGIAEQPLHLVQPGVSRTRLWFRRADL
jgi:YegS/Rv2252/BmrU family lipid kinase